MNRSFNVILIAGIFMCITGQAMAYTVVDTGTPSNAGGGWALGNIPAGYSDGAPYDAYSQSLAAKFTLDQAATITSVFGWINNGNSNNVSGIVPIDYATISIYGDAAPGALGTSASVPDSGNIKFSRDLAVMNADPAWVGFSSLNLDLAAGSYWVAFEAPQFSSFAGGMPAPAPNPVGSEAFNVNNSGWNAYNLGLGVQISALPSSTVVTPEPVSAVLFVVGGGIMAFSRRRWNNKLTSTLHG